MEKIIQLSQDKNVYHYQNKLEFPTASYLLISIVILAQPNGL